MLRISSYSSPWYVLPRVDGAMAGRFEPSNPVSAEVRGSAGACLEEVFCNVWTILVLRGIFQREAERVARNRDRKRSASFALAMLALAVFGLPAVGQRP